MNHTQGQLSVSAYFTKLKTIWEELYVKHVNYQFLKVSGNLSFASTLTSHINKFSPHAKACVFYGYSPWIKGYKVYDIVSKHFFFSKDCYFHIKIKWMVH